VIPSAADVRQLIDRLRTGESVLNLAGSPLAAMGEKWEKDLPNQG